jgi:hypothetical protein
MKHRGREHTTLTETATLVVDELLKVANGRIKMIAPGEISTGARGRSGQRFVTVAETTAGFSLIITGQSVQKVAVHVTGDAAQAAKISGEIFAALQKSKSLRDFTLKYRTRDL